MSERFYITTPIYYVNGLPHIGHAYTTIAADVATRWRDLKGQRTYFLTGTDEHGQKAYESALARSMTPKAHCDEMVTHWKAMWERLNIAYTRFIRTTDDDHVACVQAALNKLWEAGLIYQDSYTGWYSVAAERFWSERDLVDGKCPETGQPVQRITEINYFFRMSRFGDALIEHIKRHPEFIRPESRRNEVLGFLRQGLGDLCISRPKSRLPWGIELPFDDQYVTYVWFDALLNYLSGIGYHPNQPEGSWREWWPVDFHLIGKDILTTHAVYWSAMLMALELPLPKTLYAHGWWTSSEGEKISKTLGNVIDVGLLADAYGVDAARYFFLREIAFGADGMFSYDGFLTRYNADLANDLGNLAHRALSMTRNWLGGEVPEAGEPGQAETALRQVAARAVSSYATALDDLQFNQALEALWELVGAGNKYVDTEQPWVLNKQGDPRLPTVQRHVLETCAVVGCVLLPFMPERAGELLRRLGLTPDDARRLLPGLLEQGQAGELAFDLLTPGTTLDVGKPLFPRFREQPASIAKLFQEPAPAKAPEVPKISFDDFAKVQLKVGRVNKAEAHPKADRLLVLEVDIGEPSPRTIVAGIAAHVQPDDLVGRNVIVVANLKPAKLRGIKSEGMLLAASTDAALDIATVDMPPGTEVR